MGQTGRRGQRGRSVGDPRRSGKQARNVPQPDADVKRGVGKGVVKILDLLQLMGSMFELGLLYVSDMRWRVATKTFRKRSE